MICDTLENLNRYRGIHKNLDTAIDYLTAYHIAHDLIELPLGRIEVDGENVFINVMDADLHPDEGSHLEYHHKYADLQIDLTGGEGWGFTTNPGTEVGAFRGDIGFQDSPDVVSGSFFSSRGSCTAPAWRVRNALMSAKQSSKSRWRVELWRRKNCLPRSKAVSSSVVRHWRRSRSTPKKAA